MKLHQTTYLARESFRTLGRHKGIMALSIIIMSLTLLVLAVFLMMTNNVLELLDRTREEFRVYVYLDDGLPRPTVEDYHHRLLALEGVESIMFISKEQALGEFRSQLGEEQSILEALETNPLPASFRIVLKEGFRDKESVQNIAQEVASLDGVEEVNYGKDFIERFTFLARVFLYVDATLGIIVLLSSIFIISNTVRLTILSRRRSIEILKLVGATNRFITTPFVMEGAFQGGLAAALSIGMLAAVYTALKNILPGVSFLTADEVVLYVVTCMAIGSLGSYTALRRFLRL